MAYIPTLNDPTKKPDPFLASGGAPGSVVSGSAPSAPPPASDGGQRFGAMRAFFAANQPQADAQIGTITQPIEAKANEATDLAGQASTMYGDEGGADLAGKSMTARDDAKAMLRDTESVGGLAGLLGEGRDATYTEGQRNADAYLYGRAPGMDAFRSKWGGVMGALNPTYATPIPLSEPKTPEITPTTPPPRTQREPVVPDDPATGPNRKRREPTTTTPARR